MNEIDMLYTSVPDIELYNNIFDDLKKIFFEYMKAKIPVVSVLSALKQEKLMKIEEKRLSRLLDDIKEKIQTIDKSKIDYDFVKTEEFARVVFDMFDKARTDYRDEKLKYYANILLNYSTIEFSKEWYKERFIEKITRYTPEHIIVMKKIYDLCRNTLYGMNKYDNEKNIINVQFRPSEIITEDKKTEICFGDFVDDRLIYYVSDSKIVYGLTEEGYTFINLLKDQLGNI